jgi:2'-5' RNA ligase
MTTGASESAVVVPCPQADVAVDVWRRRLDPSCRLGVPAHVTLLYPFVAPSELDAGVLERLEDVANRVDGFEFSLVAVRWFRDVAVYLAPEPVEPFRQLTDALVAAFPGHPPYGGIHDPIVHHLTVGDGAAVADMRRAEAALQAALPIRERASHLHVMVGGDSERSWRVVSQIALGRARPDEGKAREGA